MMPTTSMKIVLLYFIISTSLPNIFSINPSSMTQREASINCPSKQYWETQNSKCSNCISPCYNCTSSTACADCIEGYVLQQDKTCVACRDENCKDCDITTLYCRICFDLYWMWEGKCKKCIDHCDKCNSSNGCLKCSKGYNQPRGEIGCKSDEETDRNYIYIYILNYYLGVTLIVYCVLGGCAFLAILCVCYNFRYKIKDKLCCCFNSNYIYIYIYRKERKRA